MDGPLIVRTDNFQAEVMVILLVANKDVNKGLNSYFASAESENLDRTNAKLFISYASVISPKVTQGKVGQESSIKKYLAGLQRVHRNYEKLHPE